MTIANKLPEITTTIDHLVTVGELKAVEAWMEETKPLLDEYAVRMLKKSQTDQKISWYKVFEMEATYCNDNEMPVIYIAGKAFDRTAATSGVTIFIEVWVVDDGCVATRYIREAQ